MLQMLLQGFGIVFKTPINVLMILVGTAVGIVFGALPGLTTVAALSMFLPITYAMASGTGSQYTAIYIGGMRRVGVCNSAQYSRNAKLHSNML